MVDRRRGSSLYPVISGQRKDLAAIATRTVLSGMSSIYTQAYKSRMRKYEGMAKTQLGIPVVSVGNITLGGTGKTPVCRYLAKQYEDSSMKVGIATRGYGREGAGTGILRSGKEVLDWHNCGDESVLYITGTKDVIVAVDPDRSKAAVALEKDFARDVVLLDDGYQFVTLARDVNIAVMDSKAPFGYGKLFPSGLLREPVSSLERAHVFWLAKADLMDLSQKEHVIKRLQKDFGGRPIVESIYRPRCCRTLFGGGTAHPVGALSGALAMCVSGIGNPEAFESLVERLSGIAPHNFRFTDHHPFGEKDLRDVEDEALRKSVDVIITTEKDAVRIPGYFNPRCEWWSLEVGVSVTEVHGSLSGLKLVKIQ